MDQSAKALDRMVQAVLAVSQVVAPVDQGCDDAQMVFHQEVHQVMAQFLVSLERILQRSVEQHPSYYVSPEAEPLHQNQYLREEQ